MAAPAALPATPDLASPIHSHPELSRGSESRRGQDGEREGDRERERERERRNVRYGGRRRIQTEEERRRCGSSW